MNLNDEFEEIKKGFLAQVPADVVKVIAEESEKLISSGIAEKALSKGDMMPSFSLVGASGKTVNSEDMLAKGPMVLSFYRGAWCPYCNLELRAFQDALPEIRRLGANLVAISPNLPDTSLTLVEKHALEFEVLSDRGCEVASRFGLVFTLPERLRPVYTQFGIDIAGENGDDTFMLPIPATYVADRSGRIVFSFVNADYTTRAEPEKIVEALRKSGQALP